MKIYIRMISRRLKNLREEKNLTQEELAHELGVSRQSIISVEKGKCIPSLPLVLRMAEMFDRSFGDLFFQKNPQKGGDKMPRDLMPWSPFNDLDRFFDDEESQRRRMVTLATPPINVKQIEDSVILTADIPGVTENDIDIEIGDSFVDISGERKEEKEEKEEGYFRREVSYGSFQRRIPLPTEIVADKSEATIKEGQLTIVMPKLKPSKPKVTKVKVKKI